jgi:cobalt-zinc-cadmium efflux system membrane fusion protein
VSRMFYPKVAYLKAVLSAGLVLFAAGCGEKRKSDPVAEAPPANLPVEHVGDTGTVKVEHPEQFPTAEAAVYEAADELNVTGVVAPDVSRAVPVISIATGRVLEVHARLGDTVTKGQLLMKVQSTDISGAFSDYRQAMADQTLAKTQLERAKILLDKGAISGKDYELAANIAEKTQITVENVRERIRILGADLTHPSSVLEIVSPISGVITDQQVTAAAGVQGLSATNPFTVSDLSTVWIICDVYENDLSNIRLGESVTVKLNAYPNQIFSGRVSNIGAVLDPALRTAKVRLEMKNPGNMRVGMFLTATFRGAGKQRHASVPATAVLHLHDRDWVYVPAGEKSYRQVEVKGGKMLPSNMQEILTGLAPGDKVVSNALVLQNTTES